MSHAFTTLARRAATTTAVVAIALSVLPSLDAPTASAATVWHVDDDGRVGASGRSGDPMNTITAAVRRAGNGDSIVVAAGRYHEQVQVYGKQLDIVGAGIDETVLDGAVPVAGWRSVNGRWAAPWATNFSRAEDIQTTADRREAGFPEQFFVDGKALTEVTSIGAVGAGSFYNDIANKQVWIGTDPSGRLVEGSDLNWGLYLNKANGSTVSGLTVQRYATAQSHMAAVRAYSNDATLIDVAARENAYQGISAIGTNIEFRGVVADSNGHAGLHGHRADNFSVGDSTITNNNRELFDPRWAAGGIKVTTSDQFSITGSVVDDNQGPAIWIDLDVTNVTIAGNVVRDNLRSGLMLELSSDIIAVDNVITGNGQAGIYVLESQRTQVWHNTSMDNHWDLRILTGPRADVIDVDVANNTFGGSVPSGQAVVHADDWTSKRSAAQMRITWDGNQYWLPGSSNGRWISRVQNWPAPQSLSTTLVAHQQAVGNQDATASFSTADANPFAPGYASGDGRAPEGSLVRSPLPTDVAAAAGQQAGRSFPAGALTVHPTVVPVGPQSPVDPAAPTDPEAPIYVPRSVSATPTDDTVLVAWSPPLGGQQPVAYVVWVNGVEVATSTQLSALTAPRVTTAYVQVQAVASTGTRSVKSAPVVAVVGKPLTGPDGGTGGNPVDPVDPVTVDPGTQTATPLRPAVRLTSSD